MYGSALDWFVFVLECVVLYFVVMYCIVLGCDGLCVFICYCIAL